MVSRFRKTKFLKTRHPDIAPPEISARLIREIKAGSKTGFLKVTQPALTRVELREKAVKAMLRTENRKINSF